MSPDRSMGASAPGQEAGSPTPAPVPAAAKPSVRLAEIQAWLGPKAIFESAGTLPSFIIPETELLNCARQLRDHGYDYLLFVTAVDYPAQNLMELVYVVAAFEGGEEFALVCRIPRQEPRIQSVAGIWATAEWHEREVYDLFGVHFDGHPDLRRILLDDTWHGHPLRKDYVDQGHDVMKRPY
jgi:NADH-quinone oxidoreductase subunit C